MVEAKIRASSHWWWFDSRSVANKNRSPWLQSTIAELDGKAKRMLNLIEEDADSFAARAEMYYRKRPELINMVEDFYRAYRSLAEKYDQIKSEPGTRLLTPPWNHPSFVKYQLPDKFLPTEKTYDSFSDSFDESEESGESGVDDPEEEFEDSYPSMEEEEDASSAAGKDELLKLTEEIQKLKEENRIQKEELIQKDEEKREVIRQLSLAMEVLKEENLELRKTIAKDNSRNKSPIKSNKLKGRFWGKIFNGFPKAEG